MKTITIEIFELKQLIADAVSSGITKALRSDLQLHNANLPLSSYAARRAAIARKWARLVLEHLAFKPADLIFAIACDQDPFDDVLIAINKDGEDVRALAEVDRRGDLSKVAPLGQVARLVQMNR